MIESSQTEMNPIDGWLLASLIFDSMRPFKNKLYTDEMSMIANHNPIWKSNSCEFHTTTKKQIIYVWKQKRE